MLTMKVMRSRICCSAMVVAVLLAIAVRMPACAAGAEDMVGSPAPLNHILDPPSQCGKDVGCVTTVDGSYAVIDCKCTGPPQHYGTNPGFVYKCVNSFSTPNEAGFYWWNVTVDGATVNVTVELQGTQDPSEVTENNVTQPIGIPRSFGETLSSFNGNMEQLTLDASYVQVNASQNTTGTVRAQLAWFSCTDQFNPVRPTATYPQSSNDVTVAVGWSLPTLSSFPYMDQLSYSVLRKVDGEGNYSVIAQGIPANTLSYTDTVPYTCQSHAEYTVMTTFTNGGKTANCSQTYFQGSVSLSAAPGSPGTPTVDFDSLTVGEGSFQWSETTAMNGCDDVSYALTITSSQGATVGQAMTTGVHNTSALVSFSQPLVYDSEYTVVVVCKTAAGVSTGSQSYFTAPSKTPRSRKKTGVAVGVSVAVVLLIVAGVFVMQKKRRSAYHSI